MPNQMKKMTILANTAVATADAILIVFAILQPAIRDAASPWVSDVASLDGSRNHCSMQNITAFELAICRSLVRLPSGSAV